MFLDILHKIPIHMFVTTELIASVRWVLAQVPRLRLPLPADEAELRDREQLRQGQDAGHHVTQLPR